MLALDLCPLAVSNSYYHGTGQMTWHLGSFHSGRGVLFLAFFFFRLFSFLSPFYWAFWEVREGITRRSVYSLRDDLKR